MAVIKTKRLSTKNVVNLTNLNNSRISLACTNNKSTSYTGSSGVKVAVPYTINYVVVGGGGGGGRDSAFCGIPGGAGAGGVLQGSLPNIAPGTTYPVCIGGGGATNFSGSASVFGPVVAFGGGSGAGATPVAACPANNGGPGGSGGGVSSKHPNAPANLPLVGQGTPGQGFPGGTSNPPIGGGWGGGGGASAAGSVGLSTTNGGPGGAGITISASGIPAVIVGGGGGAGGAVYKPPSNLWYVGGVGGSGGGGRGAMGCNPCQPAAPIPGTGTPSPGTPGCATPSYPAWFSGQPGTSGTGGGGGGGGLIIATPNAYRTAGGTGGPGVVYVSALTACSSFAVATGYSSTGTNGSYTWWKFTGSGSFKA